MNFSDLMILAIVVAIALATFVIFMLFRLRNRALPAQTNVDEADEPVQTEPTRYPSKGLLVVEEVFQSLDSRELSLRNALESSVAPVAIAYSPISEVELSKMKLVPVMNPTLQQGLVQVAKTLNPKGPILYQVVLPKGAELVKAVGKAGFRGFSRTGGKTVQAVLKPVAIGGAVAAAWPALAVGATVFALDMVAQREQRAFQDKVLMYLGRMDEKDYNTRVVRQQTTDSMLTSAISQMLDGRNPNLDNALQGAHDEFHTAQMFLQKHSGVVEKLLDANGKVDYRELELALGGKTKDFDHFMRELNLARSAIALKRKSLVADATSAAMHDPENPYKAFSKYLDFQAQSIDQAEAAVVALADSLSNIELKGRWHDKPLELMPALNRKKTVAARQEKIRARIAPPKIDRDTQISFMLSASGEVLQVLPPEEAESDSPSETNR